VDRAVEGRPLDEQDLVDGRTLFVADRTGLVAIDTANLRQRARGLDGTSLKSLRVSGGWV